MATVKKIKKAQRGTLSAKDSMNIYANRGDSLRAAAASKMQAGKNPSKDIKAAKEARANEERLAKKVYGTKPSKKFKMGGTMKKKMQAGGVAGKQPKAGMVDPKGAYTKVQMRTLGSMKKGGKMSKMSKKK